MNINSGDIIYVKRNGYRHFGIYAGGNHVVHYHKEKNPLLCDGIIAETSMETFMSSSNILYVMNGPGPTAQHDLFEWILQRLFNGEIKAFSPQETVQRARSKLGKKGYNLLLNNCEHFAFWCKTGIAQSAQVDDLLACLLIFAPPHQPKATSADACRLTANPIQPS